MAVVIEYAPPAVRVSAVPDVSHDETAAREIRRGHPTHLGEL